MYNSYCVSGSAIALVSIAVNVLTVVSFAAIANVPSSGSVFDVPGSDSKKEEYYITLTGKCEPSHTKSKVMIRIDSAISWKGTPHPPNPMNVLDSLSLFTQTANHNAVLTSPVSPHVQAFTIRETTFGYDEANSNYLHVDALQDFTFSSTNSEHCSLTIDPLIPPCDSSLGCYGWLDSKSTVTSCYYSEGTKTKYSTCKKYCSDAFHAC